MNKLVLIIFISVFTIGIISCTKKIIDPVNITTGNNDSLSYISGKWFWYKTLIHDTSRGRTATDTFYNDLSTYDFSKNHVVYTTAYYKYNNSTVNDSMKYYISGSRLGLVRFTTLNDTGWYDIKNCNSTYLMIYSKAVYTSTNPPTAVEYWQYFAK